MSALQRAARGTPSMGELFQFICAHCGESVSVELPKIQ
jgi:hypothetical protein